MSAVRVVVTGAPGAGKTTVLDLLAARGWTVVPEAATEVNEQLAAAGATEAWRAPDFPDRIVALQLERERAAGDEGVQLLDRSVVCTLALARYLALPVPAALRDALRRVEGEGRYDRRAILVRPVGRFRRTVARRISYEDSLRFERVHAATYRDLGFDLYDLPAGRRSRGPIRSGLCSTPGDCARPHRGPDDRSDLRRLPPGLSVVPDDAPDPGYACWAAEAGKSGGREIRGLAEAVRCNTLLP